MGLWVRRAHSDRRLSLLFPPEGARLGTSSVDPSETRVGLFASSGPVQGQHNKRSSSCVSSDTDVDVGCEHLILCSDAHTEKNMSSRNLSPLRPTTSVEPLWACTVSSSDKSCVFLHLRATSRDGCRGKWPRSKARLIRRFLPLRKDPLRRRETPTNSNQSDPQRDLGLETTKTTRLGKPHTLETLPAVLPFYVTSVRFGSSWPSL